MRKLKNCDCGEPTYSDKCNLCYAEQAIEQAQKQAEQEPLTQMPIGFFSERKGAPVIFPAAPKLSNGQLLYTIPPDCPNCASREAQAKELSEKLAAIEQAQKQELVGEAYLCDRCKTPFDMDWECPSCGHNMATKEPVYTSPPQRQTLLIGEESDAFKAWFDAVWIGDGDQGETIPTSGKEYDKYLSQYTLAFGAWMAAKKAAHGIKGEA